MNGASNMCSNDDWVQGIPTKLAKLSSEGEVFGKLMISGFHDISSHYNK